MKYLSIIIGAVLLLGAASCTSTGEVDRSVTARELQLAADDLEDASELLTDERLVEQLELCAVLIRAVGQGTVDGVADGNAAEIALAALEAAEDLPFDLDDHDQEVALVAIKLAKMVLRRLVYYLPEG